MKNLLISILILTSASLLAQDKVNPNKPFGTLHSEPGYITINELSTGFGLGKTGPDYSKFFFGFTTIHGYQINKRCTTSGGTGILFYDGGALLPLFIDVRFRFDLKPVTPYLWNQEGVLINFSDFQDSKIFVALGGGGQYAFSKNFAANLGIGGMIQSSGLRDSFFVVKGGVTYVF
jgi:hypothetical protein